MKVSKTVCLDERTAALAGSKKNLSEWVRARLLAEDEGVLDEFTEKLANLPTRRLVAILLARVQADNRDTTTTEAMQELEIYLLAVMLEGMN